MKKGLVIFLILIIALLVNVSVYAATYDATGDWDFTFYDPIEVAGSVWRVNISQDPIEDTFIFSSGPLIRLNNHQFLGIGGDISGADYSVSDLASGVTGVPAAGQVALVLDFSLSTPQECTGTLEGTHNFGTTTSSFTGAKVPIPGAVWLLGSALFGLVGLRKRFMKR